VNRRSVVITLIIILVAAGGYSLTYWQQLRKSHQWLEEMSGKDDKQAAAAMEQLATRGVRVYQPLVELARSSEPEARWRSAAMLGQLGQPKAAEVLTPMLDAPEATVRAAAAEALGHLGIEDAVGKLGQLVASDQEKLEVRISAARALTLIPDQAAVPQLAGTLAYQPAVDDEATDNSWQLRVEAARALGAAATAEAIEALVQRLTDAREPDARVRTAIAYALGDAVIQSGSADEGATSALDALIEAAEDETGDVRVAAIDSLLRVSWPKGQSDRIEQVLEKAKADPHYWVRQAVTEES